MLDVPAERVPLRGVREDMSHQVCPGYDVRPDLVRRFDEDPTYQEAVLRAIVPRSKTLHDLLIHLLPYVARPAWEPPS